MSAFDEFIANEGIEIIISAPDNQNQDRVSERGIRSVQYVARCSAIQMKAPCIFWKKMLDMNSYTLNCTSQSSVIDCNTPCEVYWSALNSKKIKA